MPNVPKPSYQLSKGSHHGHDQSDSESSGLSASKNTYPFNHVCRYLKMKDESRRAPSRKQTSALPINKCCDTIRSTLTANNFSENLWYHPPNCWLEYYGVSLTDYQKYIPDNRSKTKAKKSKSPVVSSESETEVKSEGSKEGYISFPEPPMPEPPEERQEVHLELEHVSVEASQNQTLNEPQITPVDRQTIEQIRTKNSPTLNPEAAPFRPTLVLKTHLKSGILNNSMQKSTIQPSKVRKV